MSLFIVDLSGEISVRALHSLFTAVRFDRYLNITDCLERSEKMGQPTAAGSYSTPPYIIPCQ